ncbi:MAG TPA: DUF1778 domain-containing protein [Acidimicrobiia bacterium]|nr:DUF1778 domain-containing protein [Acidimicrobiia bacterium]
MQLSQATFRLEAAVEAQLRLGAAELVSIGAELLEVLRPAVRQAMMDVVEMAAQEVNGQLVGHRVDIRIVDGDPELVVSADDSRIPLPPSLPGSGDTSDTEARITLRLPGYLKDLIAEAADVAGDSVNTFVIDALRSRAYQRSPGNSVKRTIDL